MNYSTSHSICSNHFDVSHKSVMHSAFLNQTGKLITWYLHGFGHVCYVTKQCCLPNKCVHLLCRCKLHL